jgi:hypothetical protein
MVLSNNGGINKSLETYDFTGLDAPSRTLSASTATPFLTKIFLQDIALSGIYQPINLFSTYLMYHYLSISY